MDFSFELEQLEQGVRTPELIQKIISKHKERAEKMKLLYERYKTTSVPIFDRTLDDPMEVNNQVNNDFFSEIIDTKVGYFAGSPVSYLTENDDSGDGIIKEFGDRNRLADLDAEATKFAAICGYGARFIYIDTDGKERAANVNPWEAILLGEKGMDEPDYGLRYYKSFNEQGKEQLRVELCESGLITEYRGSISELKEFKKTNQPFSVCQMYGIMNNEELQGDGEKVLALIDAYDRAISDVNSEIEAFRLAYMAFYGVEAPSPEDEQSFAKTGTFYFRNDGQGGGQKAEFISKSLQDTAIENHLNRLHNNIYRFSQTPDMADEAFAGNSSGVAMKFKILALENKTAGFERKFKSSAIRMFEILQSSWAKRSIQIDPYTIEMKFTRTFPLDLLYEAQASAQLKGLVSEETRLSQLSFVANPAEEVMSMESESELYDLGGDDHGQVGSTSSRSTEKVKQERKKVTQAD
ncbi:phage portal protein [Peribacillus muralis]|uniref:phage portal protein n=1 Tax=Peribacillus muralis TaxID=264697 RepID=UPI003D0644EF